MMDRAVKSPLIPWTRSSRGSDGNIKQKKKTGAVFPPPTCSWTPQSRPLGPDGSELVLTELLWQTPHRTVSSSPRSSLTLPAEEREGRGVQSARGMTAANQERAVSDWSSEGAAAVDVGDVVNYLTCWWQLLEIKTTQLDLGVSEP